MICVVDGCVLLDHLRGVVEARDAIAAYDEPRLSALTVVEMQRIHAAVYRPRPTQRSDALDVALAAFTIVPVDGRIAKLAAQIAGTTGIPLWDSVILATARVDGVALLTRHGGYGPDAPDVLIPYDAGDTILERMRRSIART